MGSGISPYPYPLIYPQDEHERLLIERLAGLGVLVERETEVLVLIAQGLSNAEIAGRLVMSPATAKTHVSRILTKLGLRDRAQLVIAAYESGLITPGG